MHLIDANSQETWPMDLQKALEDNEASISAYHAERRRIDRLAEEDVMLRVHRPSNPHGDVWQGILSIADQSTAGRKIKGYHATRLTDGERGNVRRNGLEVLSVALLERRLEALLAEDGISSSVHTALMEQHQASDENRASMLWFGFTRRPLRDEWGIARFFRSWGGEALYNSHEDRKTTGPALRIPGRPSIITAVVPVEGVNSFMSVGQRLVNIWCEGKGISAGHGAEFEGYVKADVPASCILEITQLGDTAFNEMTRHEEWRMPLA